MAQFGGISGLGAPINYYGMIPDFRGEALQETQNQLGIAQLQQAKSQASIQQQQLQQMKAFQAELPGAINDPQKLQALAVKYPSQVGAIKDQLQFKSSQDVAAVSSATSDLQTAAQVGPEAVAQAIVKHAGTIQQKGATPQQLMQLYVNDPPRFNSFIGTVKLGSMSAKEQFEVQDKQQGRKTDEEKLQEAMRSNRASEAAQWANVNIARQNVGLRRMELEDKKYDRQISRETNGLKLAGLQDKRQENLRAIEQGKRDKADAYNVGMDAMTRTMETASNVLNSDGFSGYFGTNFNPFSNRKIPGTAAADTEALVDTLKSQGFMSGIQQMKGMGSLSNAEGEKIMSAIGSLTPGQSEKSAKSAINTIIQTTRLAQKRMSQKYGKDVLQYQQERASATGVDTPQTPSSPVTQAQPPVQGGYSSLWGD